MNKRTVCACCCRVVATRDVEEIDHPEWRGTHNVCRPCIDEWAAEGSLPGLRVDTLEYADACQSLRNSVHRLSFMGVCPPEEFRCRVYVVPEPEPMTEAQARAYVLAEATGSGFAPRGAEWSALVDSMCADGLVRLESGHLCAAEVLK